MAEKTSPVRGRIATREIGYAVSYPGDYWLLDSETTPELRWPLSVFVYDRMRRQDAQIMSVMRAITHLNELNNPFVQPGISVRTTSTDHLPIAQARLQRYHNGGWVYFGPILRVG